jgi:hypothetical protein
VFLLYLLGPIKRLAPDWGAALPLDAPLMSWGETMDLLLTLQKFAILPRKKI